MILLRQPTCQPKHATDSGSNVVENTKAYGCIYNLNFHISMNFEMFCREIEGTFKAEIPIAQDWQTTPCPQSLYYNHGQYMDEGKIKGMDFIVRELSDKSTSSRAILPLVNVEDVKNSGYSFFPSLDVIQFGFEDDSKTNLYITIYLRALEVNHFLKINLAEVYLMANKVQKEIRAIKYIDVNIISFRAQYKDNFGCFQKAVIDLLDVIDLSIIVSEKDYTKIVELLENKLQLSETVIIATGVENLCNCVNRFNEKHPGSYHPDLISSINDLQGLYNDLIELTYRTSIYEHITRKEDEVTKQMKALIEHFRKIGETEC